MTDAAHVFGSDLQWSADGDILSVSGSTEGRQRVLRRVLTIPGNYIWEPAYGGGAPALIGSLAPPSRVEGAIRAQMLQEQAVTQSPPPDVTVTEPVIGAMQVTIQYQDAQTGDGILLGVTLTP